MALSTEDFLHNPEIRSYIQRAHILRDRKDFLVSDVTDRAGLQYVDLVQEGGGVLGIALVGYTHILEEAGVRFLNLAGTSAGAINTLMMAALGPLDAPKSRELLEIISHKNLFDLVDGNRAQKRLIQRYIDGKKGLLFHVILAALSIIKTLKNQLGLNPGDDFETWMTGILASWGIVTTDDLISLRNRLPEGLATRSGTALTGFKPRTVLIASEITTQTKVHFPEMADLYWHDPERVPPARYVRASMSIPLFFEPYVVGTLPDGPDAKERWQEKVRYRGDIPGTVRFVDGGILSNFPINVFHRPNTVPRMPTFGVRLSASRERHNTTDRFFPFVWAMINTMRHLYDYDFLLRNPDYQHLICRLDTDNDFNWLDFNMSDKSKIRLFQRGAQKAIGFLEHFDWEGYKKVRRELIPVLPS
jgi:NTE family protein